MPTATPASGADSGTSVGRTQVFLSYSHADEVWRDRLRTHLGVLERQHVIEIWADTRLQIGEDWQAHIDGALKSCRVALLVITANFLASEYIQSVEVRTLLERHSEDGLAILPVIARPLRLAAGGIRRQSSMPAVGRQSPVARVGAGNRSRSRPPHVRSRCAGQPAPGPIRECRY
jgi:hypothetical protein